ncbi:MAG: penicillin-binding protein 2 [Lentisphaerota bacterium]
MIERGYTGRLVLVVSLLTLVWAGLGTRLVFLHLGSNESLRARIESIRKVEEEIPVGRGRILDRHKNILALDLPVKNVCADPQTILADGHLQFIGAQLARMLQLDPAMVLTRLNRPNRRFEYVKKFVPEDTAEKIERMQLNGIFMRETSTRYYPHNSLMCHVLGFSNMEGVGSAGVEQRFNTYMKGRTGLLISEKDGHRRELYNRRSLEIDPEQGADVQLTLDQNIQYMVEKVLDAAMQEYRAKGAWAVVERVGTGEILALANRPAYDLNLYRTTPTDKMLNRAIGYVFEPGSTFKVGVIAAALNEGTVTPEEIFDCENGAWHYMGRVLHDFHPYGNLSVADILKKSSNIGAAKVALTLGEARLEKYLRDFGFGCPTGLDLPGEEGGILFPRSKWSKLSMSRIPMGQGVGVTAMQMLNMLCCIANNGFLMKPYMAQSIVDAEGHTVARMDPEVVGHPIREDTARLMQKLLLRVTEEGGTGAKARVNGYPVAGKTGTAQKAIPGGYSSEANIASFMGFIPADNPEVGIMVIVDEPQPIHTGGQVAAPLFSAIASQVVRYLDIPSGTNSAVIVNEELLPSEEYVEDM